MESFINYYYKTSTTIDGYLVCGGRVLIDAREDKSLGPILVGHATVTLRVDAPAGDAYAMLHWAPDINKKIPEVIEMYVLRGKLESSFARIPHWHSPIPKDVRFHLLKKCQAKLTALGYDLEEKVREEAVFSARLV